MLSNSVLAEKVMYRLSMLAHEKIERSRTNSTLRLFSKKNRIAEASKIDVPAVKACPSWRTKAALKTTKK